MRSLPVALGAALMIGGCGGSDSTAPASATSTATAAALTAMADGLQDEYRAAAVYESVLEQFGPVLPFVNVLQAEQQHAASITALFTLRGLAVPPKAPVGALPTFSSVSDACAFATTAEVENIALYDRLLALDVPLDVRRVFEANRRASLDKHLPAFERCGPTVIGVR